MSAAEQAERIRGAGRLRAGLIIFVLEEALQAAGVAAVADKAKLDDRLLFIQIDREPRWKFNWQYS